jgi:hypothetical protein
LQDHQIESALEEIEFGVRHEPSCATTTGR